MKFCADQREAGGLGQRTQRLSGYQIVCVWLDLLMITSPVRIVTPNHFAVPTMMRS